MTTATLDTNLVDDQELIALAAAAGIDVVHTTVTDRELAGSGVVTAGGKSAQIVEAIVLGESVLGLCVLGADSDTENFETLLKVISDGAFPRPGNRDNLSDGQIRQLRDAMIFCTHVREGRDVFVTNDKKGFIDNKRREFLEKTFDTRILTAEEFRKLCSQKDF